MLALILVLVYYKSMTHWKHNPTELYSFICDHKVKHDGRNPTYAEMSRRFDTSNATIQNLLATLSGRGLIMFDGRNFSVVGGAYVPPKLEEKC